MWPLFLVDDKASWYVQDTSSEESEEEIKPLPVMVEVAADTF